jgi:hypothetical protein
MLICSSAFSPLLKNFSISRSFVVFCPDLRERVNGGGVGVVEEGGGTVASQPSWSCARAAREPKMPVGNYIWWLKRRGGRKKMENVQSGFQERLEGREGERGARSLLRENEWRRGRTDEDHRPDSSDLEKREVRHRTSEFDSGGVEKRKRNRQELGWPVSGQGQIRKIDERLQVKGLLAS